MIEPYQAIGLVPTMWGIRRREDIAKNLEHLEHLFHATIGVGGLDQPIKLVATPDGALQVFTAERMDPAIGRRGIMMANEGSYPENARGLAMNGAEVVYRASFPHRASDAFEVQTRARALDNNMFVIAPNVGTYHLTVDSETPIDTFGGGSLIVDHVGRVMGRHDYSGASSWVAGTIDVEALRHFRANAKWGNWMKDLTTEQYRLIYDTPVYPKNLYLDRAPYTHDEYRREVLEPQVQALHDRGIYATPDEPAATAQPEAEPLTAAPDRD